jgi:serine/threonine protein kinase
MTQTPGTPAYMPPEVMVANPKYDTSVDEFSYGIMMIYMFSGQWPEPQVGQIRTEPNGGMTPVSEAERREVFLRAIGNDYPLMDIILKCIHNHPQARAHASEIVERLAEMVLQFPASFANRLDEALRQNEALSGEIRDLREENRRTEALDKENRDLKKEVSDLQKENIDIREQQRALREEIHTHVDGKCDSREIQDLRNKYEISVVTVVKYRISHPLGCS